MNNSTKRKKQAGNSQKRRNALLKGLSGRGIRLSRRGIALTVRGHEVIVVGPFEVLGAAVSPDGVVDGAFIEAQDADGKVRAGHVPMEALQEPKRLGSHLAAIGLDPPIEIAHLKAVAIFIHEMSGLQRCLRLDREGIHRLESGDAVHYVGAIGGQFIAPAEATLKGIPPARSIYQVRGTLEGWKAGLEPIFKKNPVVVACALIPFAAACPLLVNCAGLSALLTGPSTTGKSTLARLAQSVNYSPELLHRWNGTDNGIEALAALHCDAVLVLDELGTAAQGGLGNLIYRLSGGEGKARATSSGDARAPVTIRCSVLATGEVTRAEHGRFTGELLRDGQEARLVSIPVSERYGVFSALPPDCEGGAELSRRLLTVVLSDYGTAGPAFVRALVENQEAIIRLAPEKMKRYREEIVARAVCNDLTPVEGRVLEGFGTLALAGSLAVHFGILPVSKEDVMDAVTHVFGLWFGRWREAGESSHNRSVRQVRGWFQQHAISDFVPLAEWDTSSRRLRIGYVLNHRKEGPLYLVHPEAMRDVVCANLSVDEVLSALLEAGLLATPKKGRQWLQRMPGVPKGSKKSRMRFYAIRDLILFDQ